MQLLATEIGAVRDELRAAVEPSRVKGLSDRLKAAAADFESSHPRLNAAVERVIDTLAFYNL